MPARASWVWLACLFTVLSCSCLVLSLESTRPCSWAALLRCRLASALAVASADVELCNSASRDFTISFRELTRSPISSRSLHVCQIVVVSYLSLLPPPSAHLIQLQLQLCNSVLHRRQVVLLAVHIGPQAVPQAMTLCPHLTQLQLGVISLRLQAPEDGCGSWGYPGLLPQPSHLFPCLRRCSISKTDCALGEQTYLFVKKFEVVSIFCK